MIREFWQDRKEEKKRLKELKKQNKKLPASREQRAYKIFGVCLTLFIIFGFFIKACGGPSNTDDFTWSSLLGITEEMKDQLETPVSKKELLFNKQIDIVDWSYCKDMLTNAGLASVIVDDKIDSLVLVEKTATLTSPICLDSRMLGALSHNMIINSVYSDDVELIEVLLETTDDKLVIKSLVGLNLTTVILGADSLPSVFVTTTSTLQILNNKLYALNSNCKINKLEDSDNSDILEVINKSSLSSIEYYTNELIAKQVNEFATGVNSRVRINGSNIELY